MNLRMATEADAPLVRELWEEFCTEVPPPPGGEETSMQAPLDELEQRLRL
jgi:hypothetical protein